MAKSGLWSGENQQKTQEIKPKGYSTTENMAFQAMLVPGIPLARWSDLKYT
jgi:hypothetical protein